MRHVDYKSEQNSESQCHTVVVLPSFIPGNILLPDRLFMKEDMSHNKPVSHPIPILILSYHVCVYVCKCAHVHVSAHYVEVRGTPPVLFVYFFIYLSIYLFETRSLTSLELNKHICSCFLASKPKSQPVSKLPNARIRSISSHCSLLNVGLELNFRS